MIVLAVAYPLITHLAVLRRSEALTAVSLLILAALISAPKLRRGSVAAWCAVPVVIASLILLARSQAAWVPLYAPPVLINFFVAWLFGHTLGAQQTPLIERLVRLLHAPDEHLDPAVWRYARRLTLAWTLLFCGLGLLNLGLALCVVPEGILALLGYDPPIRVSAQMWSLCANLLDYLVAGAFFLVEYIYRGRRFPQQPYRSLFDFIRRAAAVGQRVVGPRSP